MLKLVEGGTTMVWLKSNVMTLKRHLWNEISACPIREWRECLALSKVLEYIFDILLSLPSILCYSSFSSFVLFFWRSQTL